MLSRTVTLLRNAAHRVLASDSPNQLAAGFAVGMILGLVPKGNLIALSLCVLLFSLRINKGLALAAAVIFSLVGPFADSFTHKLGMEVLTARPLQPIFASVLSVPLGPWIGFHNTVVTGSLLVGLYVAYPAFWFVRSVCRLLQAGAARPRQNEAPATLAFSEPQSIIPRQGAA